MLDAFLARGLTRSRKPARPALSASLRRPGARKIAGRASRRSSVRRRDALPSVERTRRDRDPRAPPQAIPRTSRRAGAADGRRERGDAGGGSGAGLGGCGRGAGHERDRQPGAGGRPRPRSGAPHHRPRPSLRQPGPTRRTWRPPSPAAGSRGGRCRWSVSCLSGCCIYALGAEAVGSGGARPTRRGRRGLRAAAPAATGAAAAVA